MTDFIINPSKYHPFVLTNAKKGELLISGICIHEDPERFFMPIINWVDDYLANESDTLKITFELQYFNNSSSKYLFQLIQSIDNYAKNGKKVRIDWLYYTEDADMKEEGENFAVLFQLPIKITEQEIPTQFSLKKTDNTPLVYFDQSGDIIIEGNSTGERPWEYYYPLIKWADVMRINSEPQNLKAEILLYTIDKLNLHYIRHFLTQLDLINRKDDRSVEVIWKYSSEEMKSIGIDYLLNSNIKQTFLKT